MSPVEYLTPDAAIARVPDWSGLDVSWETLGGGITNHNYVVTVSGRPDLPWGDKYVMRIPGAGTDTFIDRDCEHLNHVAAAEAGVTPPILYVVEPERCTIVPFIEGETMHAKTLTGRPGSARQGRRRHPRLSRQGHLRQRDPRLRHDPAFMAMAMDADAPLPDDIEEMLGSRRSDRAGDGSATFRSRSPATTICSRRTSSSTATAGCGSSTGSTGA